MRHWRELIQAVLVPVLVASGAKIGLAEDFVFPPNFMWGTATAAHQVEGNNTNSDWWAWEQVPGHIKNGDHSGLACDHYNRYESDLDLAKAIGCNAYRFSVEWARIEPSPGQFDEAQLEHYRKVLLACRARGITPMVTLFHFTLPQWVADQGGFENPATIDLFARFASVCGRRLGDLADYWCTLNEPVVYVLAGYGAGKFPPGKSNLHAAACVYANLIHAHARAYVALKTSLAGVRPAGAPPAMIGLAQHLRVFDPATAWNPADIVMARVCERINNWVFLDACRTGKFTIWFPGEAPVYGHDPELSGALDFVGVNYYSRDMVRFNPTSLGLIDRLVPKGAPVSDMGWEIYPEGMYRVLMAARKYGKPIFITENGIADATGTKRSAFIRDHLRWVGEAMRAGVDVRGYFYWSLMDNFEWAEGFWPRFGLYSMNYATQERTLTEGGRTFHEIAATGRLHLDAAIKDSPVSPQVPPGAGPGR